MKRILSIVLSGLTITSTLLFAASISYSFAPKSTKSSEAVMTESNKFSETIPAATASAVTETPPPAQLILGTATPQPVPSARPSATPTAAPATSSTPAPIVIVHNIVQETPIPSPSPTAQPLNDSPQPTATPAQSATPIPKVFLEINSPAGKSNFEVSWSETINTCQLLEKAKAEGKIASLTLDDKYLESFGTLMVAEMNGFTNNWVFTVNGESPMGCSLSFPNAGDQIIWNYLTSF